MTCDNEISICECHVSFTQSDPAHGHVVAVRAKPVGLYKVCGGQSVISYMYNQASLVGFNTSGLL